MASPIHHHHHHHHMHHVMPPLTPVEEKKVIPLHDADKAHDVLELAPPKKSSIHQTSNTNQPVSLLDQLLHGRITVGTFTDKVEIPKEKSKQKLYDNDQMSAFSDKNLNKAKLDQALSLGDLYASLSQIIQDETALAQAQNNQINGLNTKIDAYNNQITPADANAIANLNAGTSLYNSGQISQTDYLNNYVTPYNNYVASRNPAIQSTISDYSSTLNTLDTTDIPANNSNIANQNTKREGFKIPDIPTQQTVASQPTYTLPSVSLPLPPTPPPQQNQNTNFPPPNPPESFVSDPRTSLGTAANIPDPPSSQNFLGTYFLPAFNAATKSIAIQDKPRDMQVAQHDYDRTFNRGKDPKKVYITDTTVTPHAHISQKSFIGGGNVQSAVQVSSQPTPHNEVLFSNSMFSANNEQFQLQFTTPLLSNVKTFGTLLLHDSGLHALRPALHALKLEGLTPHEAILSFKVTSGVSVSSAIGQLVASGVIGTSVQALVAADSKGRAADIKSQDKAATILTAELNIALLQTAINGIAIALQAPGLATHLAANVKGVPANLASVPLTAGQVVSDSLRQTFLTTTLAGTLSRDTGITTQQAGIIINNAVTAFLSSNKTKNEALLRHEIVSSLVSQGVSKNEAEALANQASTIVQQESQGTRILHTELLNQTQDVNLLAGQIQQQLHVSASEASTIAAQAIGQVLQNSAITNDTEFQVLLQLQLEKQGVNAPKAARIAGNLVTGVAAAAPKDTSPLINPEPATTLNPQQLRTQIAQHVVSLLTPTLGPEEARRHGQRIAEIVVGAPGSTTSLLALLNSNVSVLAREGADHAGGVIIPNFREFISSNIDAFIFNKRILDPANTFFLTGMTSTRLTDMPLPKNYLKYLDFYV